MELPLRVLLLISGMASSRRLLDEAEELFLTRTRAEPAKAATAAIPMKASLIIGELDLATVGALRKEGRRSEIWLDLISKGVLAKVCVELGATYPCSMVVYLHWI
jgi:hypothetical protein